MRYNQNRLGNFVQVEPYLYLGMGQVCLYHEAPENFFSRGVDFKDIKILDPWIYCLYIKVFV